MKAYGPRASLALERGGQQMLTRVLLHMVEAPRPVHVPPNARVGLELTIDKVSDRAVFLIEHVEDIGLTERPGVERLAARRRIERGAIENDLPSIALQVHFAHHSVEFNQVRVRVVETIRRHEPPADP